jgi:hypothetical protein
VLADGLPLGGNLAVNVIREQTEHRLLVRQLERKLLTTQTSAVAVRLHQRMRQVEADAGTPAPRGGGTPG